MKRYRILGFDFDARVHQLTTQIEDQWDESVKQLWRDNRAKTERALVSQFGEYAADQKRRNFIDLGPKLPSVLAFHNRFLQQIRVAFVMDAYYPALTAACSLGERILNHLILTLRDDFKNTPEYKRVRSKGSFDDWKVPIDTLAAWSVLLPEVVTDFRQLLKCRHDAIHFRPEVDTNDRALALVAIRSLGSILEKQFGAMGTQPWFLTDVAGEFYIKKAWENRPFIQRIYLPTCRKVGPRHEVASMAVVPWTVRDDYDYEEREITDEEFCALRRGALGY